MAIDDNQKLGIGLICLGLAFTMFGVLFFFDSALIAIGIENNDAFLSHNLFS